MQRHHNHANLLSTNSQWNTYYKGSKGHVKNKKLMLNLMLTSQTIKTNLLTLPNGLALFIESFPNLLAWFGHSKHLSLPQNIHLCTENQWNVEKKLMLTSQTIKTNLLILPNSLEFFITSVPNLLAWFGHSKHLSLPQNIQRDQWFLIFFGGWTPIELLITAIEFL